MIGDRLGRCMQANSPLVQARRVINALLRVPPIESSPLRVSVSISVSMKDSTWNKTVKFSVPKEST